MRIAILGRSEALFGVLEKLESEGHEITAIVSPPETEDYTKKSKHFRDFAKSRSIPFSKEARMDELSGFVQTGNPEIAVSINYPLVISSEVIETFPLGILNVHGGDLPRYRGNACQAWAILNGENEIGLCVHKMEADRLDSRDIISRDYLPISLSTSITTVHEWIVTRSPSLVKEALSRLGENPLFILEKQSESAKVPLRCFPRRPEDGRIDWAKSARDVVRLIKASSKPYRGAFCFLDNTEVTVWDAELEDFPSEFMTVPGQVLSVGTDFLSVACGIDSVRLTNWEFSAANELSQSRVAKSTRQRFS